MSGEILPYEQVNKARADEIVEIRKHNLYSKVPLEKCWENTGKRPLGVRWVDVNKGDIANPEYRSRLVGYHSKYARGQMKIDFIDIKRADFHSPSRRKNVHRTS